LACRAFVLTLPRKFAAVKVEGVDRAIAEVADKEGIVKLAEALKRRPAIPHG